MADPLDDTPSILLGHGDLVGVGDWAIVTGHTKDSPDYLYNDGMPWQVGHMSKRDGHVGLRLDTRISSITFNAGEVGGDFWRTFQRVPLDDVPLYLREALPAPPKYKLRQLTRRQILSLFSGKSTITCYTVIGRGHPGESFHAVISEVMPLMLLWEERPGKKRPLLRRLQLTYPVIVGDGTRFGGSEYCIDTSGNIVAQRYYHLSLFAEGGEGIPLIQFMEAAISS